VLISLPMTVKVQPCSSCFKVSVSTITFRWRRSKVVTIPIFHVDAFAEKPFEGNPAAVCLLGEERPEGWMQSVAAEMNLSATEFIRPVDRGYELRWFTPTVEIALCGHATLASAHVMWTENVAGRSGPIRFHTKSGILKCNQAGEIIELNFPATSPIETVPESGLLD